MSEADRTSVDNPSQLPPENPSAPSPPLGGLILYRTTAQNCETPKRPFIRATNHLSKEVVYFQPACKKWDCPHCSVINKLKWRSRAVLGCAYFEREGLKMDFVTITSHERLSVSGSIAVMQKAWHKLNMRVHREADTCEYLLVPEFHKSGKAHLHLLTTAILAKKFWKDNARSCGFGYQSDVQEVNELGGVASYVSKYISKSLEGANLPKYFRRVRTSAGWPKLPDMPQNPDWKFTLLNQDVALNFEQRVWQNQGYRVVMADGVAAWDWIENGGLL